jgi:hypothetical protein
MSSPVTDGEWRLLSDWDENHQRKWISAQPVAGEGGAIQYVVKTETWTPALENLLEANKAAYNAGIGQRWGEGKVAWSVPEDVYYRDILPAKKQDDKAYLKRFFNDPDHRAFRTFPGRL